MAEEELPPSKLGTKDHWESVYEREVRVFNDVGDEGEVWFGETSVTKMRKWAHRHLPSSSSSSSGRKEPLRIMECGSGNGTLLLSFLTSPGEDVQSFHLTGIDYCESAAVLARGIEQSRRENLADEIDEEEEVINDVEVEWRTEDLLRRDFGGEQWDLVMDKGTYDALCLSAEPVEEGGRLPSAVYPERIARLVKTGGFFLITSCNFTEEEIKSRYTKEGLGEYIFSGARPSRCLRRLIAKVPELTCLLSCIGFEFHSSVPHPSFAFGGKTGTTVCTVAFKKV